MMEDTVAYSIVVPVYNSERSLDELCERIINALRQLAIEIIFVDDDSKDRSWEIIQRLKLKYPTIVSAIRLQRNYGQHAATLCAFVFCRGAYAITIDDDLQFVPEDIPRLIETQQQFDADVVYGVAAGRKQPLVRRLSSDMIEKAGSIFDNYKYRGTSFRLISKKIVKEIAEHHSSSFVSIDNIVRWYTSSLVFVKVAHYARATGKSGYSFGKVLVLFFSTLTNYSDIMLRLMIYIGFTFSVLFFLLSVRFIYLKMVQNVPAGYTSIIVTILFCSSVIMLCLGIIGQYLFKAYISNQRKPLYSIKEVVE